MNDVTVYCDLLFDRAIHFPIFLLKFNDENALKCYKLDQRIVHVLLVFLKYGSKYVSWVLKLQSVRKYFLNAFFSLYTRNDITTVAFYGQF